MRVTPVGRASDACLLMAFHVGNTGSNPVGDAKDFCSFEGMNCGFSRLRYARAKLTTKGVHSGGQSSLWRIDYFTGLLSLDTGADGILSLENRRDESPSWVWIPPPPPDQNKTAKVSTHRNNDLPFSASTFDIG
jgi:hypothetical protein